MDTFGAILKIHVPRGDGEANDLAASKRLQARSKRMTQYMGEETVRGGGCNLEMWEMREDSAIEGWDEVREEGEGRWTDCTGGSWKDGGSYYRTFKVSSSNIVSAMQDGTPPFRSLSPRPRWFRSCSPPSALHPRTPRLILFLWAMFHASFVFSTLVSLATLLPRQMDRIISVPCPAFNNIACKV